MGRRAVPRRSILELCYRTEGVNGGEGDEAGGPREPLRNGPANGSLGGCLSSRHCYELRPLDRVSCISEISNPEKPIDPPAQDDEICRAPLRLGGIGHQDTRPPVNEP